MKVAIVHYWLVGMRGGEKVIEALCEMFPDADIFTHVYDPQAVSATIRRHKVRTSFIAWLPQARRRYQSYLPLMPRALEEFDLRQYDLVISSESGPAKGVITRPDAVHICYCHTPMRYLWNMYHDYRAGAAVLKRIAISFFAHRLRQWDIASAARVDHFAANSRNVAHRVLKYYRRDATVIYPPVDTTFYQPRSGQPGDFYLYVGQLIRYKRVDIAIEAFNRLGKPLIVIGDGKERNELGKLAGPTIRFLGRADDAVLRDHYARCRALIFPGEEDFGIVPVEVMASGRPVLAFGRGGVLETVVPGRTGLLFDEQTPEALINAVHRFESLEGAFDPIAIAAYAERFSKTRFHQNFRSFIDNALAASEPLRSDRGEPRSKLSQRHDAWRPHLAHG